MDFDRCHDGGGWWYEQEQRGDRANYIPQASSDPIIYTYILIFEINPTTNINYNWYKLFFEIIVYFGIWKVSQYSRMVLKLFFCLGEWEEKVYNYKFFTTFC